MDGETPTPESEIPSEEKEPISEPPKIEQQRPTSQIPKEEIQAKEEEDQRKADEIAEDLRKLVPKDSSEVLEEKRPLSIVEADEPVEQTEKRLHEVGSDKTGERFQGVFYRGESDRSQLVGLRGRYLTTDRYLAQ